VLSLIRLHRNDVCGAREAAATSARELSTVGAGYRADWHAWARALVLEADGNRADALETLSDCWDWCARCGLALNYPIIGPDLVRLAWRPKMWPGPGMSRPRSGTGWRPCPSLGLSPGCGQSLIV